MEPDEPGYDPNKAGRNRTIALVALIVVIGVVFGIFIMDNKSDTQAAVPASSSSSTVVGIPEPITSPDPPSSIQTPDRAPSSNDGAVTYRISGDGGVIGLTYPTGGGLKVVPEITNSPWSATESGVAKPSLRGLVIRGHLTCTISRGGTVIATKTAGLGVLNC